MPISWALLVVAAATPGCAHEVDFAGTMASVWAIPTGLANSTPCDQTLSYDLGCNSFWLRDSDWGVYISQRGTMWPLLRSNLGNTPGSTVLLYFPAFLADPKHAGVALGRFDIVLRDLSSIGLRVIPFIGRPDYFGSGNKNETSNPVLDSTALDYLVARIYDIVSRPIVRATASVVVRFKVAVREGEHRGFRMPPVALYYSSSVHVCMSVCVCVSLCMSLTLLRLRSESV
jgi:hypothetical protein